VADVHRKDAPASSPDWSRLTTGARVLLQATLWLQLFLNGF